MRLDSPLAETWLDELTELNGVTEMVDVSEATMSFEKDKFFDHISRNRRKIIKADWWKSSIPMWDKYPRIALNFDVSMFWRFHGG